MFKKKQIRIITPVFLLVSALILITCATFAKADYYVFFTSDMDIENVQGLQKDHKFYTEIYRMNPDGGDTTRLTHDEGNQSFLTPSPDGKSLFFVQAMDEDTEIVRVDFSGGEYDYVNEDFEKNDFYPTINESGDRLIFSSIPNVETDRDNDEEIWYVDLKTGKKEKITDNDLQDSNPVVSPDETSLVYLQSRERIVPDEDVNMYKDLKLRGLASRNVLYKYDFETKSSVPLYKEELHYMYPVYSPDGEHIAVTANYGGSNFETLILTTDGEEVGAFSFNNYGCGRYSFTDDGARLFFMCTEPNESGRQGIYYVNIEKGDFDPNVVTEEDFYIKDFSISPDGETVFFSGSTSEDYNDWSKWEIYRIEIDGSGLENLTNNNDREWYVAVSPFLPDEETD